jgi:ribonuclease BN (tRNA processing enzyme)
MGGATPLDLTIIGSGNAFADARCWSGFLLNRRVLFDAPPSALYALKQARAALDEIDTVLLSHFHGDHFFGLPFLLLEYQFPSAAGARSAPRARDLTIVGPPGVAEAVEQAAQLAFPNLLNHDAGYQRRYVEIDAGGEAEVNGLRIGAARMNHAVGSLPLALGYRAALDGRVIAYTGDSGWCDSLVEIGRGADVYVCDCNYAEGRNLPEHLSLEEVRDLRRLLDERTELVLTHLGHEARPGDIPRTRFAYDGARFTFE